MLESNNNKVKLGVLAGGDSSEREISLQTAEDVMRNIDIEKYDAHKIVIDSRADISTACEGFDFIFIALHGGFGENGEVQRILSENGIRYSGTDLKGSRICMDKNITKDILRRVGLNVPKSVERSLYINEEINFGELEEKIFEKNMRFPLVLKPVGGGSSIGVILIHDIDELKRWQESYLSNSIKPGTKLGTVLEKGLKNEGVEYMLEEFIEGIEATVSIIGNEMLPVLEVQYNSEFLDYDRKYIDQSTVKKVMIMDDEMEESIRDMVDIVSREVYLKIYGRIDIIIKDRKIYILEINTLPGLREKSFFPTSAVIAGMSYKEMLDRIILLSLNKA